MQVTITQIRFGGLSVSKGVKSEVVTAVAQPDIVVPAQDVPEQVLASHLAIAGEPIPEYIIPEFVAVGGEAVPERIIPEHIDPETSLVIPEQIISAHIAEPGEIVPEQLVPAHLGIDGEFVPERIVPAYTIPESYIAQPPVMTITGHAWQYTCTMTAMPCTGALPDFQEITGDDRYVLEKVFGFKTTTIYALELPMGPNGEEPSMQLLIGKFSQWFIGETQKMLATWIGKTITVGID